MREISRGCKFRALHIKIFTFIYKVYGYSWEKRLLSSVLDNKINFVGKSIYQIVLILSYNTYNFYIKFIIFFQKKSLLLYLSNLVYIFLFSIYLKLTFANNKRIPFCFIKPPSINFSQFISQPRSKYYLFHLFELFFAYTKNPKLYSALSIFRRRRIQVIKGTKLY